ncbi:aldehyde dehydrogenase family protein [Sphingobacterium sp. E70]|uniref:aldehyde dehydrogenase family protein n=1 Tax=Sphingobacterium sp. E70 TaxID=2853439 RepID=UPI00211BCCFD|nr:aldehyde dehydrogenase family protein [Sphingobacterium sp. E70]ULT26437.1 aldehyde dehydrogenase family protein [Sphingobacterium sp. E70]
MITYGKLEEAIAIVNRSEKPLALYVFSENKHHIQQVVQQVASGGVCINDVLIHVSNPHLPFGGVNGSGQEVAMVFLASRHFHMNAL